LQRPQQSTTQPQARSKEMNFVTEFTYAADNLRFSSSISKKKIAKPSIKHGHSGSLHHYYDNCTQSKLADELTLILSSKLECDIFEYNDRQSYLSIFRPYINQAEGLIYRINTYEYPPEFVIWEEDIPQTLAEALRNLGFLTMNQIITEAVRRLFESVDLDYFHINGLYGKVKWRIAK
jgi:hypothetical protein